ncbi:MAG: hypothetical protein V1740_02455 [Candidatus Woesearchaeota archaeon]
MIQYQSEIIFNLFRLILVLIAFFAMLIDNYKHRDLKIASFAYTFLVLGSFSGIFYLYFGFVKLEAIEITFKYLVHIFGIMLAGIMFFLTAYAANKKIMLIERKTKEAFKK